MGEKQKNALRQREGLPKREYCFPRPPPPTPALTPPHPPTLPQCRVTQHEQTLDILRDPNPAHWPTTP